MTAYVFILTNICSYPVGSIFCVSWSIHFHLINTVPYTFYSCILQLWAKLSTQHHQGAHLTSSDPWPAENSPLEGSHYSDGRRVLALCWFAGYVYAFPLRALQSSAAGCICTCCSASDRDIRRRWSWVTSDLCLAATPVEVSFHSGQWTW